MKQDLKKKFNKSYHKQYYWEKRRHQKIQCPICGKEILKMNSQNHHILHLEKYMRAAVRLDSKICAEDLDFETLVL